MAVVLVLRNTWSPAPSVARPSGRFLTRGFASPSHGGFALVGSGEIRGIGLKQPPRRVSPPPQKSSSRLAIHTIDGRGDLAIGARHRLLPDGVCHHADMTETVVSAPLAARPATSSPPGLAR
jgi:hypothetical protein